MYQSISKWMDSSGDELACVRGIYIGNTFYLCGSSGISAFDREKEYENCGNLEW